MYGINLDLSKRCSNACPGCARELLKPIPGRDITLKEMEMIADFFQAITFCGQVSDPSLHPEFHKLLRICIKRKRKVAISVAATVRKKSWWTTSFLISKGNNVEWIFGIDGLPKDSHRYRVNQDGEFLYDMMKRCAHFGIRTTWQYIIFNYNENDIDTCHKMADEHGINFMTIDSGKWYSDKLKSLQPTKNFSTLDGVSFREYT